MPKPLRVVFSASAAGQWRIDRITRVAGDFDLASAGWVNLYEGADQPAAEGVVWALRGVTSNTRYTNQAELGNLVIRQQGLGRPESRCAALIPIRKTEAWWSLAQDERRNIFEEQSRHIGIGMEYLPAIARRLHHCRELEEPFDFLTWFEYAPDASDAFEEMVRRLRDTREWLYVDREIDIRLIRAGV